MLSRRQNFDHSHSTLWGPKRFNYAPAWRFMGSDCWDFRDFGPEKWQLWRIAL